MLGLARRAALLTVGCSSDPVPCSGPAPRPPALQRMLEKMGWKEGEGLGRNRQGIAAPLVMQVGLLQLLSLPPGRLLPSRPPSCSSKSVAHEVPCIVPDCIAGC